MRYVVDIITICLFKFSCSALYFSIAVGSPMAIGRTRNTDIDSTSPNFPNLVGPSVLPATILKVKEKQTVIAVPMIT